MKDNNRAQIYPDQEHERIEKQGNKKNDSFWYSIPIHYENEFKVINSFLHSVQWFSVNWFRFVTNITIIAMHSGADVVGTVSAELTHATSPGDG